VFLCLYSHSKKSCGNPHVFSPVLLLFLAVKLASQYSEVLIQMSKQKNDEIIPRLERFSAFRRDGGKTLARKPFPLRSRPSMTPDNQADAGKSRRGPGRRFSRSGWRPLLFRVSRYFKDSTGGAAGKGLWKRHSTLFPCGEPRDGVWLFYVVSLAFAAGCTSFVKLV